MSTTNVTIAPLNLDLAQKVWETLIKAERIGIISHRQPDPDTIGSNLALQTLLKSLAKQVNSFCIDQIPLNSRFLPASSTYLQDLQPENYDLLISVDCGSSSQVGYSQNFPDLFQKNFLNIDHHSSNNNFGSLNLVQTNLSSTCEIIYHLLIYGQTKITPEIATYLLFGLYYDTGSFMHSNVTPAVLEMAENLLKAGANQPLIIKNLYQNFSLEKFHLWGQVLEKIKFSSQNSAVVVIDHQKLQPYQNVSENLSGVIDYISMTKESNFAAIISEEKAGQIKGSLRTRHNHINLSELAAQMGGGGHKKASGFSFPGKLSAEISWKIITP